MKNYLSQTLTNYTYFTDETILSKKLNHLNKKDKKTLDDLKNLFMRLNDDISIEDILHTIGKLESNIFVIDSALKDVDDELCFHIKALNQENQKLVNNLFMMCEDKKLVKE